MDSEEMYAEISAIIDERITLQIDTVLLQIEIAHLRQKTAVDKAEINRLLTRCFDTKAKKLVEEIWRIHNLIQQEERDDTTARLLLPIKDLPGFNSSLSTRLLNAVRRATGDRSPRVYQLVQMSEEDLLRLKNIGHRSVRAARDILENNNLPPLGTELPEDITDLES